MLSYALLMCRLNFALDNMFTEATFCLSNVQAAHNLSTLVGRSRVIWQRHRTANLLFLATMRLSRDSTNSFKRSKPPQFPQRTQRRRTCGEFCTRLSSQKMLSTAYQVHVSALLVLCYLPRHPFFFNVSYHVAPTD
jgi:hypothetical protein